MTTLLGSLPAWLPWILLVVLWIVIIGLAAGTPARRAGFRRGLRRPFG